MNSNKNRVGNFTSSQIFRLMAPSRTAEYIAEKRWERKLKRSLKQEFFSRPTSWGNFVEGIAFERLGLQYTIRSKVTTVHPEYNFWADSTDLISADAVGNIKCPELKAFCQMIDTDGDPEKLKAFKYGEYFWQLVSAACVHNKRYCELIPYVPYFNDLVAIQERAALADDEYKWIFNADHETLPYLHRDGEYKDLNIIRFDADPYKAALTERVVMAGQELDEANVTEQLKKSVEV